MREELKRNNSIGDLSGIKYFIDIVLKDESIKYDSALQICSFAPNIRLNFRSAVAFFEYLGFLTISGKKIEPTESGRVLSNTTEENFGEIICKVCFEKICKEGLVNISDLHFNTNTSTFNLLKHSFPIDNAIFRNVLIQLKALKITLSDTLEINSNYEEIFKKFRRTINKKTTLEELKEKLEKQALQGDKAELFVLDLEREKFKNTPLITKIKRISELDVSAGYDIVSFSAYSSVEYDRFIEVKSYIGNPHFYWSKNEIEVAKLLREKYYLYLVNFLKIEDQNYFPTIIQNPSEVLFNSKEWLMESTAYLFVKSDE